MVKLTSYLTYLGTLPFIFCAFCFVTGILSLPVLGDTGQVLSIYGLVITSFMAGSHWGQHLNLRDKWSLYLPLFSTLSAILVWISFLILPFHLLFIAFGITFMAFLYIDKHLLLEGHLNPDYFRTRVFGTGIVVLTLLISGLYS